MLRRALALSLVALAGCKSLLPSVDDCSEPQPYQNAREIPPLVVPEGLDLPNTRSALRIPDVTTPARPSDGRCLDYPPRYRTAPADTRGSSGG